ncbi:hypothetical protein ACIPW5_08180 [Streptomyces sp. NPDC090077]|uniref:hypothetical protein n=1 Tax=Streptomyces sp. NPDC090077 TaxID=3365938 RepID=UPI0037FFF4A7
MDVVPLPPIRHLRSVLRGLSGNPALGQDLAVDLLPHLMSAIRLVLRAGTGPGTTLCEAFLADGRALELAHAPVLPDGIAARLAAHPDPEVRARRAQEEGPKAGRHALFARDPEPAVRIGLADNPRLAPEQAAVLAADGDRTVRQTLAQRRQTPEEDVLRTLLTDPDAEVRATACRRHRPPDDLHRVLFADPAVRSRIVPFLHLAPDTAAELAADPDEDVREALAAHPELPAALRDTLAGDASPYVRAEVFRRADTPPDQRARIHAWLTAGARRFDEGLPPPGPVGGEGWDLDETDLGCKLAMAGVSTGAYPWVQADPLPHTSSPYPGLRLAAACSERLPLDARRAMLADEDAAVRLVALARLPEVDPAVAEDLDRRHHRQTKFRDRPADYAAFPPETLRRFAGDPDAWIRVLALRDPELPSVLLERLAADEAESVRRACARHPRLPVEALVRLLGDAEESVAEAAAAAPGLPPEVMRAVLGQADTAAGPPPPAAPCDGGCR